MSWLPFCVSEFWLSFESLYESVSFANVVPLIDKNSCRLSRCYLLVVFTCMFEEEKMKLGNIEYPNSRKNLSTITFILTKTKGKNEMYDYRI